MFLPPDVLQRPLRLLLDQNSHHPFMASPATTVAAALGVG